MAKERAKRGHGIPITTKQVEHTLGRANIHRVSLFKDSDGDYCWLVYDDEKERYEKVYVKSPKGTGTVTRLDAMTQPEWVEDAKRADLVVNLPQPAIGPFFIIQGNSFCGFSYYGPFRDENEAREWATTFNFREFHVVKADDSGGALCV